MRKEGFCAYGAQVCEEIRHALSLIETMSAEQASLTELLFRLQVCLVLFQPCYPPTRIAVWKRALRRVLRALYALDLCERLTVWIGSLHVESPYRAGVRRAQLRLSQHHQLLVQRLQQAWERFRRARVLNELGGLSRRWRDSFAHEPICLEYARQRWHMLVREHLPALEDTKQEVETRWGRVRTLRVAGAILEPILGESLVPEAWHHHYQQLDAERFRRYAYRQIACLIETEQALTAHYHGHLRSFGKVRMGMEYLLQAFASTPTEANLPHNQRDLELP